MKLVEYMPSEGEPFQLQMAYIQLISQSYEVEFRDAIGLRVQRHTSHPNLELGDNSIIATGEPSEMSQEPMLPSRAAHVYLISLARTYSHGHLTVTLLLALDSFRTRRCLSCFNVPRVALLAISFLHL